LLCHLHQNIYNFVSGTARFYGDHLIMVTGSTFNSHIHHVALLRPWIRCFTTIISAW